MTTALFSLAALSTKMALLGVILWTQLYFLRRDPARLRSNLCFAALGAIPLLALIPVITARFLHGFAVSVPFALSFTAAPVTRNANSTSVLNWIFWCWILGAAIMLLRMLVGRVALIAVSRDAVSRDAAHVGRSGEAALDVRVAAVQSPVLTGLLRPVILVPPAYSQWTESQREMVLLHEQNHYRHADHWAIALAQVVRAILWFHPVSWLLAARLCREQELACDEAVVAAGHASHQYAAFLLDTIRGLSSSQMFSCSMAGSGTGSFKLRFARLLDPRPFQFRRGVLLLCITAIAAFVFAATAVTPGWSQNSKTEPGKIYKVGNGVMKLLNKVEPGYPEDAKDARIEGAVLLSVVVTAEGKATNIEVVRSLDPGLDQKAIDAVTQWVFQPATKDGEAVAVKATIEIDFRLK